MSHTEPKQVLESDECGRSRTRKRSDSEDAEELLKLFRTRTGHASYVARLVNEFDQMYDRCSAPQHLAAQLGKMEDAFKTLEEAHMKYISMARVIDSSKIEVTELHMEEMSVRVRDARVRLEAIGQPHDTNPGCSASAVSGSSKTSSVMARAVAKKAALQAKLSAIDKFQDLERRRQEAEMEIERLKLETELDAANAEEEALRAFEDDVGSTRSRVGTPDSQQQRQPTSYQQQQRPTPYQQQQQRPTPYQQQQRPTSPSPSLHARPLASDEYFRQRELVERINLPKTTLVKFDGDPKRFWIFLRSFDSMVGSASIDDGTKLHHLLEACTGKAAKVLEPCAIMERGYERARQLLEERFGNPYQISEAWIKQITGGPAVKPNNKDSLQEFADEVRSCCETLKAMNMEKEIDTRLRMVSIIARLPNYIQSRWRRLAVDKLDAQGRYPDIDELVRFLDRVARESNDPYFGFIPEKQEKQNESRKRQTSRQKGTSFATQSAEAKPAESKTKEPKGNESTRNCFQCSGGHRLRECEAFLKKSADERLKLVKEKHLCYNCLNGNKHRAYDCRFQNTCGESGCTQKHSKLIHKALVALKQTAESTAPRQESNTKPNTRGDAVGCASSTDNPTEISLPIVPVLVRPVGQDYYTSTLALLDPGSNRTFCTRSLMESMGLKGEDTTINLQTLNTGKPIKACEVSFEVTGTGKKKRRIELRKVLAIDPFPTFHKMIDDGDLQKWDHLRDVELKNLEEGEVRLIIGQDHQEALKPLEVRSGGNEEPFAVRTCLGWTVNGPVGKHERSATAMSTVMSAFARVEGEAKLEAQVAEFWKVDSCGITDETVSMSAEDREVLSLWDEKTSLVDGHYELPLPWKENFSNLPNNREVAERRLASLGRRLQKNPDVAQKYKQGIDDLLDKGYAEQVGDQVARPGGIWYVPHHNVHNENKPDKVRIVFDCPSEFRGASLNKAMCQGPDLTNNLLGVLQRFRESEVALMSDIEAMFHQVRVHPLDRDVLRFLWWNEGATMNEVETLRMTRHLFGGNWSPSAANYALQRTAKDNQDRFPPDVIAAVTQNFYVDDCLISVQDEGSAIRMVRELSELLSMGGFHLTKWMSNSREVLGSIPVDSRAKQIKHMDLDLNSSLPVERALGVHWDTESDEFGVQIKNLEPVYTRRGILSTMSSVFDPLGIVCPYVIRAKIIFQDECRLVDKGWDDSLEDFNKLAWKNWMADLPLLQETRMKRCLIPKDFGSIKRSELHHFSDASERAYGAVSYLRIENEAGKVHCCFMLGKAKLAPIKKLTIPRLELLGAVVATKLDETLRKELKLSLSHESVFWTDSMLVLHYVNSRTKRFKTFVANRIALIHSNSSPEQWRHVRSEENPADDASRGLSAADMVTARRWLQGPDFLWLDKSDWPETPELKSETINDPEEKSQAKALTTYVEECADDALTSMILRYSSWWRLLRAVAWLKRFKDYCKDKYLKGNSGPKELKQTRNLTTSELSNAANDIVRHVQRTSFAQGPGQCPKDLRKLNPFLEDEILKVGGRIDRAPLGYEARHPAILPKGHHVTDLIVRHFHEKSHHAGRDQVLADIRQEYWIVKGRSAVNRVLSHCIPCRKVNAPRAIQQMAPLPKARVTPDKPPFTYVGVDYFGPFMVKQGRSRVKRYGCLFTCLTSRAVHIEIAHTLDQDSFICALQRFSSRRGKPEVMYSDNGTNFRGGYRELTESIASWNEDKLNKTLAQQQIQWHFNPPSASHMGGIWERMIRATRHVLAHLLKEQCVSDETLLTLMTEVERVLNDRPLTAVDDHSDSSEPLTPSKLLLLRSNTSLPMGVFSKTDRYSRRWWRQAQYLADVFWLRWVREYLPLLQERQKWCEVKRNFNVNDIVLVVDETLPRGRWPLGRVLETYPDSKGQVRSVKLRFGGSDKVRPIHKLVFLEGENL